MTTKVREAIGDILSRQQELLEIGGTDTNIAKLARALLITIQELESMECKCFFGFVCPRCDISQKIEKIF